MLTVIFAIFAIFTALCVSTSAADSQGVITVAIHIHLFSGMSGWGSGACARTGFCGFCAEFLLPFV